MANSAAPEHFVYLYRTARGRPTYVGYGHDPQRALAHAGASHNVELRQFIESGKFDLTLAGPYRDSVEAKNVEAALISALQPAFNKAPGDGRQFRAIGVPTALAARSALRSLTLGELGERTGGALLVYLAPGDFLTDGRKKFDMVEPDDADALSNIRGKWDLNAHLAQWATDPAQGPQVLVGVHGTNPKHRFVVGAIAIDTADWQNPNDFVAERNRWLVPLTQPINLDAAELRGRRVEDVKFGQFSWQLHIWVDGHGVKRHPIK